MRAILEDVQLGIPDRVLHGFSESSGRCHQVVPAESDLRGRSNRSELRRGVMADHRVRLLDERSDRLHRTATHEIGERLDVLRLLRVELRREAPWKEALDNHLRHTVQRPGHHLPTLYDRLDVWIALVPAAVQR